MLEGKEIAEISWVPTNTQIAHPLTKKGVPLPRPAYKHKQIGLLACLRKITSGYGWK